MAAKPCSADFKCLAEIGAGSYSDITLVRNLHTRQINALKSVTIKLLKKERKERQAHREKDAMIDCHDCINIINLFSTFLDARMGTLNYVLEYVPNGDLQVVQRHTQSCLSLSAVDHILIQLCQATQYLHSKHIIHRDLKPENLLLTYKNMVKLCDFGTSINIDKETPKTFLGSAYYVSPEMMTTKDATYETDFWSVGVVLFEMVVGCKMFPGRSEYYVMQKIEKMNYVDLPEEAPYRDEIQGLVNNDRAVRRKTFDKLLKKFESYDLQEDFKFYAYSPYGKIEPAYEYIDFAPISNYDVVVADETDKVSSRLLESDERDALGTVERKDLIEPPADSVYYGEKIQAFFNGIKVFNEFTWKVLAKQQKHNKWSAFLGPTQLILMQGELYVLDGYHRKVLRRNADPPAEEQMFMVIVDLKEPSKKEMVGIIEGKLRFRIDLHSNFAHSHVPVRCEKLTDEHFTILKQYPERSWTFEASDENAEDWCAVVNQTVPEGLLEHKQE